MLKGIYIVVALLICIRAVRRRIDLVTFFAAGILYYSIPCLFGIASIVSFNGYYYYQVIDDKMILISIVQLVIAYVFMWLPSAPRVEPEPKPPQKDLTIKPFHFILWAGVIIFIEEIVLQIGLSNITSMRKSEFMALGSGGLGFAYWLILYCWVYGLDRRRPFFIAVSGFFLMVTVFLGSRAYLATALVLAILILAPRAEKVIRGKVKRRNLRYIVLGMIFVVVLVIYKSVYQAILRLDFASAAQTLSSPDTYRSLGIFGEAQTVFALLDYTVSSGFHLPLVDSLARILTIIPFFGSKIPTQYDLRYSSIMKNDIFDSTYGLASNVWGETYAMFGYLGLFGFEILLLLILYLAGRKLSSKGDSKAIWLVPCAYCSFYVTRLDLQQAIASFKIALMTWMIFAVLSMMMYGRLTPHKERLGGPLQGEKHDF